ncbi:hypothetical protein P8452_09777 [Trifolium repens]|nr:hypothetical protein QL285_053313 [Trifolium repens]WJX20190.1 hypothetical protein P8452_09777 [Trifolium repens]
MVTSQVVEASEPPKKPIFPFFPNFNFNFQIPQFPFPPKHHRHDDGGDDKNKETPKLQSEGAQHGPNVVTFPKSQQVVVVPSPESDGQNKTKTTNPVIIYQAYAIGAYFLARWIWARWDEKKGRGGSPDDENRGAQNNE